MSVYAQADAEHADLERERRELEEEPERELAEPTAIYVARGLDPARAAAAGGTRFGRRIRLRRRGADRGRARRHSRARGGAPVLPGALRVAFWGAAAMAITAGIGKAFGTTV